MRISHIAWNLAGLTVPVVVAAFTVPQLLNTLGYEKFGLLALAWGLIGYAGALDLGLGRALTQMVASMRGENRLADIPDSLATASRITMATGLLAGCLITLFAVLDGTSIIRAETTSTTEIKLSVLLLAIALPAQAMSATFKGVNEAFMNFKGVSILRAGLGVVTFAGPYVVSVFTVELPWLVMTLVVSRLLALFIYKKLAINCLHRDSVMVDKASYSPRIARKLFGFGGWVTVSSIISPILTQADRFFIAGIISAAAVSVYVLPYEVVVQSLVLVGAISSVMYPALSTMMKEQQSNWRAYFHKWLVRVAGIMACVCFGLFLILPWLLPNWIGKNLDQQSILIGQILCVGVFANSIGTMFYSVVHASGRPDLTAKVHILELPIYVASLFLLIRFYGLNGAALAWTGRMIIDAFAIYYLAKKIAR